MDFPHLGDTSFPLLGNVNVYQYQNNFDYTRWKQNTRVRLTNVLWNSDYKDVVKFASDSARDKWFDDNPDQYQITLTADHSIPPEGGIKLPIPFDVAARYNYLVVDIPVMTSASEPIEYEYEHGTRRWFFFVDEVSSRAPNTTMFHISLDVWTQFHNDVEINYLFLERGHAPVAATDTDRYLLNPIANNDYLLTPDVTPTTSDVVRTSAFVPFGAGAKYVCMVSTVPPDGISALGAVSSSSDYTYGPISYSNGPDRVGYQLVVNGLGVGDGYDYSTLNNPSAPINHSNKVVGQGPWVYAISATECYGNGTFFEDVISTCPNFMNTILGCFIASADMLTLSNTKRTIANHYVYEATGSSTATAVPKMTKADFAYPERYQKFAKLYTYPYASLELTDNEGKSVIVRIENTGDIVANKITELAFPYLNMRTFFTGINGSGSMEYSWVALDGNTITNHLPKSDWFEHCFDHEIPVFALMMNPQKSFALDSFYGKIQDERRKLLRDYQNATRLANVDFENTVDNWDANVNNTERDASTLETNTYNTVNTNTSNANATIATNTAKVAQNDAGATARTNLGNNKLDDDVSAANSEIFATSVSQQETTAATTQNNIYGELGGATLSLATTTAMMAGAGAVAGGVGGSVIPGAGTMAGALGGAVVGGVAGVASSIASCASSSANADVIVQANMAVCNAAINANVDKLNAAMTYNSAATQSMEIERDALVQLDNDLLSGNTQRSNNNLATNNGNTANTLRNNMSESSNTGKNNAVWLQQVRIANNKQTLQADLDDAQTDLFANKMKGAVQVGTISGSNVADYHMTRGVQIKVKTMPDAEVRQVGDWFARFGYALEQVWDVSESGLCPMKHFCYWKCRDIWVDDRKSSNNTAMVLITSMFERGVTIWKDPDEVGRVSVYDN